MAYPLNENEAERIEGLRALRLVDDPDGALDRICELARDLLSVPIAVISVLEEKDQWFPNRCGLFSDRTPRDSALCNYVVAADQPLIIPDTHKDERFRDNPLVTGSPFIRFYAGMPLSLKPGLPLATFCCIDTKPRRISDRQRKMLSDLAALALAQLRLRQANLSLAWTSSHDWLTGLENRLGLHARLETTLAEAAAAGRRAALLLIDLDHFKQVNDLSGHDIGDDVLKLTAQRLRSQLPPGAFAARTGGDEFAILATDLADLEEAQELGAGLVAALEGLDLAVAGSRMSSLPATVHASVGISLYPDHAADAPALLKTADLALYGAKKAGGNRFAVYTPRLAVQMQRVSSMHARARRALVNGEIVPFYQPKITLGTGRVSGFEALLRLQGPNGLEPPATVEAAFSDPFLSVELGRAMLACIVADMRDWRDAGIPFGSVAINVTEFDLCADLSGRLLAPLAAAGLPPSALQVEVTENVFLGQQAHAAKEVLASLRAGGIQVALDDFGTGYASLTHLREFPVDWLKLDRSFVVDMDADPKAAAIVHGVISIAQSLGIGVVADGLETKRHLDLLRRRHCDLGQGFLFAKPMAGSRVPHFLRAWTGLGRHESRPAMMQTVF